MTDNKTICSSQHSMCADNDIKSVFCRAVVGDDGEEERFQSLYVFIIHVLDVTKKG